MSAKVELVDEVGRPEVELWGASLGPVTLRTAIVVLLERSKRIEKYIRARDPIGASEFLDHDGIERLP